MANTSQARRTFIIDALITVFSTISCAVAATRSRKMNSVVSKCAYAPHVSDPSGTNAEDTTKSVEAEGGGEEK